MVATECTLLSTIAKSKNLKSKQIKSGTICIRKKKTLKILRYFERPAANITFKLFMCEYTCINNTQDYTALKPPFTIWWTSLHVIKCISIPWLHKTTSYRHVKVLAIFGLFWFSYKYKQCCDDYFVTNKYISALAGVAQWIKCQPANQRVAGSIPNQGTSLGWGPCP